MNMNAVRIENTKKQDESENVLSLHETNAVEDSTSQLISTNSITTQALTDHVSNPRPAIVRQRQNNRRAVRSFVFDVPVNNTFSRVMLAAVKYPDEITLRNYNALQHWMYIHSNKWSLIDICQSISQLYLSQSNDYDSQSKFHICLISSEAYQCIGQITQAQSYYDQSRSIVGTLNTSVSNECEREEQNRKLKKLEDIRMKLEFQLKVQCQLIEHKAPSTNDRTIEEFLEKLSDKPTGSAEECRRIWRDIVLHFVKYPNISQIGANWLLSFAKTCPSDGLPRANIQYVALNLLLFHYESTIFTERMDLDVFQTLDEIASAFDRFGDQSKQFSPIHKMSHVWGTAAIVYHLKSKRFEYFVCASMMRVSFEFLGIHFYSSGIESLYFLAQSCAPEFFQMMIVDPGVELRSLDCLNYFRRLLKTTDRCVKYSTEKVQELVREFFNYDISENSG